MGILKSKQSLLELPQHKLINDVPTKVELLLVVFRATGCNRSCPLDKGCQEKCQRCSFAVRR